MAYFKFLLDTIKKSSLDKIIHVPHNTSVILLKHFHYFFFNIKAFQMVIVAKTVCYLTSLISLLLGFFLFFNVSLIYISYDFSGSIYDGSSHEKLLMFIQLGVIILILLVINHLIFVFCCTTNIILEDKNYYFYLFTPSLVLFSINFYSSILFNAKINSYLALPLLIIYLYIIYISRNYNAIYEISRVNSIVISSIIQSLFVNINVWLILTIMFSLLWFSKLAPKIFTKLLRHVFYSYEELQPKIIAVNINLYYYLVIYRNTLRFRSLYFINLIIIPLMITYQFSYVLSFIYLYFLLSLILIVVVFFNIFLKDPETMLFHFLGQEREFQEKIIEKMSSIFEHNLDTRIKLFDGNLPGPWGVSSYLRLRNEFIESWIFEFKIILLDALESDRLTLSNEYNEDLNDNLIGIFEKFRLKQITENQFFHHLADIYSGYEAHDSDYSKLINILIANRVEVITASLKLLEKNWENFIINFIKINNKEILNCEVDYFLIKNPLMYGTINNILIKQIC